MVSATRGCPPMRVKLDDCSSRRISRQVSGRLGLSGPLGSCLAEAEDCGAEGVELFGSDAADVAECLEAGGCGERDVAENGVGEDEEGGKACGSGGFAAPVFEAGFEG